MSQSTSSSWLQSYYFTRAGVAAAWVVAAFTIGKTLPPAGAALLIAYPAWDAAANVADAQRNGGFGANPSQALNGIVSTLTALAVAAALTQGMNAVLGVFGVWAVLSGLFQLATGLRRWSVYGAQWAMILSGAQSALAGGFFVKQSFGTAVPTVADVAPYAGFGAFYFLVSALWLLVKSRRRQPVAL